MANKQIFRAVVYCEVRAGYCPGIILVKFYAFDGKILIKYFLDSIKNDFQLLQLN